MIDTGTYPIAGDHVITQAASDALILFHLESGEYYSLDGVGRSVWQLCDGGHSVAQIVSDLCGEYDAPRASIHADALDLLSMLEGEGLISAHTAPTAGGAVGPPPS
jgi:hypothetical protein